MSSYLVILVGAFVSENFVCIVHIVENFVCIVHIVSCYWHVHVGASQVEGVQVKSEIVH